MTKLLYLALILSMSLSACDAPEGYERELIENDTWPQIVSGRFSFLDSDTGDGKYAEWAIGILDIPSRSDNILIEFRDDVLKDAEIDLEFNVPDPVTLLIGQPKERYFQVQRVIKEPNN